MPKGCQKGVKRVSKEVPKGCQKGVKRVTLEPAFSRLSAGFCRNQAPSGPNGPKGPQKVSGNSCFPCRAVVGYDENGSRRLKPSTVVDVIDVWLILKSNIIIIII